MKQQHISTYLKNARSRAKRDNVPFSLTKEYLLSIATDECPVFHTPFEWGISGLGKGHMKDNCPTLDRILPELGYVEGNVAFISHRANRLKDNGTMQEHYDIADWIWSHLYAKDNATPPVPKRTNLKSRIHSQFGIISPTRLGENRDYAHDYFAAVQGENSYHSAKEGSGDSMGHGGQEMGTPQTPQSGKDYGQPEPEIVRLEFGRRYLFDKP
jgi:hypothetical protein